MGYCYKYAILIGADTHEAGEIRKAILNWLETYGLAIVTLAPEHLQNLIYIDDTKVFFHLKVETFLEVLNNKKGGSTPGDQGNCVQLLFSGEDWRGKFQEIRFENRGIWEVINLQNVDSPMKKRSNEK